jgi:carbonic anhydrase
VGRIRPAVEFTQREHCPDSEDFLHHATVANIYRSKALILEQSTIIREAVNKGNLVIEGALLDIASGQVTYL